MSITVNKIRKIEPVVRKCLEQNPATRDNDKLLILNIWTYQCPELQNGAKFNEFAVLLMKGDLVDSETITRCRRKLQENYPPLRGELWYKRHQESNDTRKNINK